MFVYAVYFLMLRCVAFLVRFPDDEPCTSLLMSRRILPPLATVFIVLRRVSL